MQQQNERPDSLFCLQVSTHTNTPVPRGAAAASAACACCVRPPPPPLLPVPESSWSEATPTVAARQESRIHDTAGTESS